MAPLADVFLRGRMDTAQLKPDTEKGLAAVGFDRLGDAHGKAFGESFASRAKELIGGIGGVIGVAAGAAKFLTDSLAEAREAVQVGNQTAAVLKSTGGAAGVSASQVKDYARQLSELAGVDHLVVQQGENILLTFTQVRNTVGKGNDIFNQATLAALNMSAALGKDLQSSVILVGKALNDPIKGLTALQRVGVSFTASQRDQIKTLVETGHAMDAQKLILRELTVEFGGAAAAIADPAKKGAIEWKDFEEQIGGGLLSTLNTLLATIHSIGGPTTVIAAAGVALLSNRIHEMAGAGGLFSDLRASWQLYSEAVQGGAPRVATAMQLASGVTDKLKGAASSVVGLFGGPWGLALTAATVGIGYFTTKMRENEQQTQATVAAYTRLGTAIQDALTAQDVTKIIKSSDELQKLIVETNRYGISASTVTSALAGEGQATATVTTLLSARREELMKTIAAHTQYGARTGPIMDDIAHKAQKEYDELGRLSNTFGKVAEAQALAAQAAGLYSQAAEAARLGMRVEADALRKQADLTQALGDATRALGADYAPLGPVLDTVADKTIRGKDAAAKYADSIKGIGAMAIPAAVQLAQYGLVADQVAGSQLNASQKGDEYKAILSGISATAAPTNASVAALTQVFGEVAGAELTAADRGALLKQAWQAMHQPAIDQTNATQNFNSALFGLKDQIDKTSTSLDIEKQAGITNRQAVESLITKNNDLYFANIAAGMSADKAGEQHRINGDKIREAGRKAGLTTVDVDNLIATYGDIPPAKNTQVTMSGAQEVLNQLKTLKIAQYALDNNVSIPAAASAIAGQSSVFNSQVPYAARFAAGGPVVGPGTGTSDDVWAKLAGGPYVRLSNGEHIITAAEVQRAGGHTAIEQWRRAIRGSAGIQARYPGDGSAGIAFAAGGPVNMPFPVNVRGTKMPYTMKQLQDKYGGGDAMVFLRGAVGRPYVWDSAGPGGYDCSGIVSAVYNVIHKRSPYNHTFSTGNEAPFFPLGGVGGILSAGWTNPGEPGPGGNSVGHTAGLLAGVPFESTGGVGVRMGAGVTPIGRFAHVGHFDQGGRWPTGTFGYNGSGRTEQVTTGATMDAVLEELRGLRADVRQVAPGVGQEINGTGRSVVQIARAR